MSYEDTKEGVESVETNTPEGQEDALADISYDGSSAAVSAKEIQPSPQAIIDQKVNFWLDQMEKNPNYYEKGAPALIKEKIENMLSNETVSHAPQYPDVNAIKAEVQDKLLFDQLKGKLQSMSAELPSSIKETVKQKVEYFRAKGFTAGEALKEAMEFARVEESYKQVVGKKESAQKSMSIPSGSTSSKTADYSEISAEDIKAMSKEEYLAYRKSTSRL